MGGITCRLRRRGSVPGREDDTPINLVIDVITISCASQVWWRCLLWVALIYKGPPKLVSVFLAVLVFLRKGPSESAARLAWTDASSKMTPPRSAFYFVKLSPYHGGGENYEK